MKYWAKWSIERSNPSKATRATSSHFKLKTPECESSEMYHIFTSLDSHSRVLSFFPPRLSSDTIKTSQCDSSQIACRGMWSSWLIYMWSSWLIQLKLLNATQAKYTISQSVLLHLISPPLFFPPPSSRADGVAIRAKQIVTWYVTKNS